MKKRIKSPWFWLVVALVLCFVSMIGTSCIASGTVLAKENSRAFL